MKQKTPNSIKEEISAITKKHLGEQTLDGFGRALGIDASKQSVYQWLNSIYTPSPLTLLSVIASPASEPWAKIWAAECLSVLQQDGPLAFEAGE